MFHDCSDAKVMYPCKTSEWRYVLRHDKAGASVLTDHALLGGLGQLAVKIRASSFSRCYKARLQAPLIAAASQGSCFYYLHCLRPESKNPMGCVCITL